MSYTQICNAPWMFIYVGALLIAVVIQCLIFMRRAKKNALELGLTNQDIRKGITTGVSISILPTIPVLLVFLSLVPLLGTPLIWLRLSIIGSAHYEAYAASVAVSAVGEELVLNGYTINGWVAAAWIMTIGGSACVLWSSLAIKPISKMYEKANAIDMGLVLSLGTGCLVGIMAFVSVAYGLSAMSTKGVVFLISFAVGALIVFVYNKMPKAKWLSDFCMAISMIVAMVAACLIF
jgi:hypothetical protein